MFIDVDSIKVKTTGVNNGNYVSLGQYLLDAKYGYHKLWGSDSGRNLAGSHSGTLVGIFPKITMQFRKMNKDELELLAPIFDSDVQTLRYYDPNKKTYVEMNTYAGDWELVNKRIINSIGKNEGFSIAFISTRKRS